MDYATRTGVSLSTLRRHIKAEKIEYRLENGKYLLPYEENGKSSFVAPVISSQSGDDVHTLQSKLRRLESDLHRAQEEVAELKMLVALYEEQMAPRRRDN